MSWQLVIAFSLTVPLLFGQLLRLRSIIWPVSEESLPTLLSLIGGGSIILLEVALPLAALGSVILGSRRWRSRREYQDWWSIGGSPLHFIRPIIILSIINTLIGWHLSQRVTPRTLRSLKSVAITLGQGHWRAIIPHLADRLDLHTQPMNLLREDLAITPLMSPHTESPHTESSHWLLKSKANDRSEVGYTFIKCDFTMREEACLSTWWWRSDEQSSKLTLHDVRYVSKQAQLTLGRLDFKLPADMRLSKLYKTFGPPNSLDNDQLDHSVHHRFIYHKRLALPLLNLILMLVGAWSGLSLNLGGCLIVAVTMVSGGLGLLRALELWARMGHLSPLVAAWLPTLILLIVTAWALRDLMRRPPQHI